MKVECSAIVNIYVIDLALVCGPAPSDRGNRRPMVRIL